MAGIAYKPLTVDVHEPGFVAKIAQENQFGPWYSLSDKEKQQLGAPWGPSNPQALNRYSYVLNNPMKWTDPGGHYISLGYEEALFLRELLQPLMEKLEQIAQDASNVVALASALVSGIGEIIGTLGSKLGSIGGKILDELTGFFGELATIASDPTNAMDVYKLLSFMNFHIEQFLFWVLADMESRGKERIVFWADPLINGRGAVYVYYNFVGPEGRVRGHAVSYKTFQSIRDMLGSATNPVSSPTR